MITIATCNLLQKMCKTVVNKVFSFRNLRRMFCFANFCECCISRNLEGEKMKKIFYEKKLNFMKLDKIFQNKYF